MFPGYVLIKTNMNTDIFYKIKTIPKCYRIVNNGTIYSKDNGEYYSTIDEEEMAPIIQLLGNGEIVDYSRVYLENSKVFVKSGPLKGMEGIIKKVDKHKNRAKILLYFLGVQKIIDVGVEIHSIP
jgi:transcription termination/antitermination protein NusG